MLHYIEDDLEEDWVHEFIDKVAGYLAAHAEFVRLYGE